MPIKGMPQLLEILSKCEAVMAKVEKGEINDQEALGYVGNMMVSFQKISDQAGLVALRRVGREIEKYVKNPSLSPEDLTALAFVFPTLKGGLKTEAIEDIRVSVLETFELLNIPVPTDWQTSKFVVTQEEPTPSAPLEEKIPPQDSKEEQKEEVKAQKSSEVEIASVDRAVKSLGGTVRTEKDGSLTIVVPPENLPKLQRLVAPVDPEMDLAANIPAETDTEKEVLAKIKEFMAAFSEGDFEKAQSVLDDLSQVKEGSEIFKEIGRIARHLHTAFKEFMQALDPALKELAMDYLPDSESRLQHLMKLTEEAANTTLDATEKIKERNKKDLDLVELLRTHLDRLKPIGKGAESRMEEIEIALLTFEESRLSDQKDLSAILSAQNFQDLSGQTVLKIMDIMKNLQERLISIIKSFGVKTDGKVKEKQELYGPAHDKVEGALRSQDEVDALLSQLGF